MTKYLILLFQLLFIVGPVSGAGISLPRDAAGWTQYTPSSTSRIVYVAATGNDTTAVVYTQATHPDWTNPFNPTGTINAFATCAAAFAQTRENEPDWILIRRGDVFYQAINGKFRSGKSATEPFLVAAYGGSGANPVFMTGQELDQYAIVKVNAGLQWTAFSGLTFYSYKRDPDNPAYVGNDGPYGISIRTGNYTTQGVLIEGCVFKFYPGNEIQHLNDTGGVDVDIRRSVFLNNYNDVSHSQGLFIHYATVRINECIFDHNGWYSQAGSGGAGQATLFNHNIYLSQPINVSISNTLSSRSSSIGIKNHSYTTTGEYVGPIITNNLILDGEVGISISSDAVDPPVHTGLTISDNVLTNIGRSRPTNRNISYYVELSNMRNATIRNNLLLNQIDLTAPDGFGLSIKNNQQNIYSTENIFYNLQYLPAVVSNYTDSYTSNSASFTNNTINFPTNSGYIASSAYNFSPTWTFSWNKYYTNRNDGARFKISGIDKTDVQWAAATGDNSTFEEVSFPDPTRSIETYMASLGETATIDAFIAKTRAQDRYNWDTHFTADAVNDYIRAGFGMGQRRLFRNVRIGEVEP